MVSDMEWVTFWVIIFYGQNCQLFFCWLHIKDADSAQYAANN